MINGMAQNIEEIKKRLPLRYPYLMIDRLLEKRSDYILALKNVTINEPFFQGHFPEPLPAVMPGTLILEAMAQTAAFLFEDVREAYLVGIDRARFQQKVAPGDQLLLHARLLKRRTGVIRAEVKAEISGETVAKATITLMSPRSQNVESHH
jgi:3-hydroxyacyl-[acyl-carrier-protein] dehydratase